MTGIHPRRITDWTAKGLIPAPKGRGNGVHRYYTMEHYHRIEDIKRLLDGNRALEDIRDYFNRDEDSEDE